MCIICSPHLIPLSFSNDDNIARASGRYWGEDKCIQRFRLRNMKENTQKNQNDNIKIDLKEMGWVGKDWIHLTQNSGRWWALMNIAINHQVS
jgi:hypothetical protein